MPDIKNFLGEKEEKENIEGNQETPETQQTFRRRLPSLERKISEIKAEDMRVRVLGTVIDKQDERIVLDDGSGRINIGFDDSVDAEINQLVRVFGRVIPIEGGFELQGEIIQDMSYVDLALHEKMQKIKRSIESQ